MTRSALTALSLTALSLAALMPNAARPAEPAATGAKAGKFPETPALTVSISPEWATSQGVVGGEILVTIRFISRHPFDALRLTPLAVAGASPRQVMRPRTRTVTSYAGSGTAFETAIAWPWSWVAIKQVAPLRSRTSTITACTRALLAASRETKGSSIKIELGSTA
ncbi:MAG: hypothetical protein ACPGVX_09425, partial [Thalassobaculaceae bacterium]